MKKRALCITIALTILFSSCMAKQKVPEQITDEVISYDSVVNHTLREEEKPAAQEKKKIEKTGGMRYFNIAMVLEGGRKQGKEEYKSLLT